MKDLPRRQREHIKDELVAIAEKLVYEYKYTVPESRRTLHELIDVTV